MKKFLIVLAGLPGTGKTTVAEILEQNLTNYKIISQNEIRRKHKLKRMPHKQEIILREIDVKTAELLNKGKGVIFDSVNRYTFRRQQMYGIASCCRKNVLTLETICYEEEAKKRMRSRPKGDGIISDPCDPKVYDKMARSWEDIETDFKYPGEDHVSYAQIDTLKLKYNPKIVSDGLRVYINKIGKILLANLEKINKDSNAKRY